MDELIQKLQQAVYNWLTDPKWKNYVADRLLETEPKERGTKLKDMVEEVFWPSASFEAIPANLETEFLTLCISYIDWAKVAARFIDGYDDPFAK